MVVVLGFVRIVPAELWTLALIYRMLFPGAFARQLRVHQPGLISGYTGIRVCTKYMYVYMYLHGELHSSFCRADLLPYFPDPETRSNTATADPPPPQFGDLLFVTHADTWGLNFGCSISIDTSLSRLDSCPGSTFFAAFEK